MYEDITSFLEALRAGGYGKTVAPPPEDGPEGRVFVMPYVAYEPKVDAFISAVNAFAISHKELGLTDYQGILKDAGLGWSFAAMESAGVSALDARTAAALVVGAVRADRFSEGTLLGFLENGCIVKWLERIKQLDT